MALSDEPDESIVQPRLPPDEQAQHALDQVCAVLVMLEDMVDAGATLRVKRSPAFPKVDPRPYLAVGLARRIDKLILGAEVVDG